MIVSLSSYVQTSKTCLEAIVSDNISIQGLYCLVIWFGLHNLILARLAAILEWGIWYSCTAIFYRRVWFSGPYWPGGKSLPQRVCNDSLRTEPKLRPYALSLKWLVDSQPVPRHQHRDGPSALQKKSSSTTPGVHRTHRFDHRTGGRFTSNHCSMWLSRKLKKSTSLLSKPKRCRLIMVSYIFKVQLPNWTSYSRSFWVSSNFPSYFQIGLRFTKLNILYGVGQLNGNLHMDKIGLGMPLCVHHTFNMFLVVP